LEIALEAGLTSRQDGDGAGTRPAKFDHVTGGNVDRARKGVVGVRLGRPGARRDDRSARALPAAVTGT